MRGWIKGGLVGAAIMFFFINFGVAISSFFRFLFEVFYIMIYGPLGQGGDFWYATIFLIISSFLLGSVVGWIIEKINNRARGEKVKKG
jgi:hypothetical protein